VYSLPTVGVHGHVGYLAAAHGYRHRQCPVGQLRVVVLGESEPHYPPGAHIHDPGCCGGCGGGFIGGAGGRSGSAPSGGGDLAAPPRVIEYRGVSRACLACGKTATATAPASVTARTRTGLVCWLGLPNCCAPTTCR
jgi:hypothetical protein